MLIPSTKEHVSAFFAAYGISGTDRDKLPDIYVEGIDDYLVNWAVLKKQYRKRKPDPLKTDCLTVEKANHTEKEDEVLYVSDTGIRVTKKTKRKTYVPLTLPPIEFEEDENGNKTGVVPSDAVAALISTIPKGKVSSKSRIKDLLTIIYSLFHPGYPIDTESNWEGYADDGSPYEYGYRLNTYRVVSDQGEIYGNGMNWRYRSKTRSRRWDSESLSAEGVPTYEANYRCYVTNLDEWEYDFADLFVTVESKRHDKDY